MSMKPQEIGPVPEEADRVARATNPKGNVYMHMRDELGSIYEDQMFTALFPRRGQPAEARHSSGASDGDAIHGGIGRSTSRRGRQRTDSTHVLAAIRDLNRLECAGETLSLAQQ
jgi:hypothetical protein